MVPPGAGYMKLELRPFTDSSLQPSLKETTNLPKLEGCGYTPNSATHTTGHELHEYGSVWDLQYSGSTRCFKTGGEK